MEEIRKEEGKPSAGPSPSSVKETSAGLRRFCIPSFFSVLIPVFQTLCFMFFYFIG
jgi:hypothetical protein